MDTVHFMQTVQKVGNCRGVIIPAATLRKLDINTHDVVELDIKLKKKLSSCHITSLIANTNIKKYRNVESINAWFNKPASGREVA